MSFIFPKRKISTMEDSQINSEHSNSKGENNTEQSETVMTFGEDGLHYSDFENVEYEEVDISESQDEFASMNTQRNCSRKRTRNFTTKECNMLCILIEDYADILGLKRNDHKTNTLKNQVWREITKKFNNNTFEEYRTPVQLKTFYENLKKKQKKLYKETENCDAAELSSNNLDSEILSENSTKRVTGLSSNFKRHNNFLDYYQRRKIELVEREIEKVKSATEQQHKLFLLQEEKLMLEIKEIKKRLKEN